MNTAGWTISAIAILIVGVIAWSVFGGGQDLQRFGRDAWRRIRQR